MGDGTASPTPGRPHWQQPGNRAWLCRAHERHVSEKPGVIAATARALRVSPPHAAGRPAPGLPGGYQLLFQVCRTSVSWMLCLSACSSRKSNMYLMASGRALPRCTVLNNVSNKSSTNFCRVPWGRGGGTQ